MSWRDEWMALRQRIRGLIQAGDMYARFVLADSSDAHGGAKSLRCQASDVHRLVDEFYKNNSALLPPLANASLERWVERHRSLFESPPDPGAETNQNALTSMLPMLAALESEITYHLSDRQQLIRRRSERAFAHLQRLIVADPEIQKKWEAAFKDHEPVCEKLGAAHLLLHGIWAFKVDAAGARTDLVFQEPLDDLEEVERAAEGLVLTEWKKASALGEVEKKFKEAREQAKRYAAGALGGIELRDYRYAVVVTKDRQDPPEDLEENGVLWRHINIAVDPKTPSKA